MIKAVMFDLYGTLAYVPNPVNDEGASDFLVGRGYEVYPQTLKAAWQYVGFVDYPKYGYKTWRSFLKRVMNKLGMELDKQTLAELVKMYGDSEWSRYPDVEYAFAVAKEADLKTAVITTIARFKFREALKPVWDKIDLLVDGFTFHCEKSNPKIYLKTLDALGVQAREAVMVGDDMQLDILLPKRLGINTILLDREGKNRGQPIDVIVCSLNEAMETITRK